jgi:hypothetical protein
VFEKGEIPAIVFGIIFAMLFILGAASPFPAGIYSEHRNIRTLSNERRTTNDIFVRPRASVPFYFESKPPLTL